jgi:enamine deaminase RidA (YjgF/YER057c/UK114 family)
MQSSAEECWKVPSASLKPCPWAGDFVFTSAQGDHGFNPADVVYDKNGLVISDGNTLPPRSMADETRATLRNLEASLMEAGCAWRISSTRQCGCAIRATSPR